MNDQDFWYDLDFDVVALAQDTFAETTFHYIWHYHAGYGDETEQCILADTPFTGAEIVQFLLYALFFEQQ